MRNGNGNINSMTKAMARPCGSKTKQWQCQAAASGKTKQWQCQKMAVPVAETTSASSSTGYNNKNVQQSTCNLRDGNGKIGSNTQAVALPRMTASLAETKTPSH